MSNKLYTQLGTAAKRALEHRPENDENGEEYGESSFGGFGEYMRRKKLKLQNQDEEIRQTIEDEPQIFKGMVIHINGYTKPPREDLHHLIVKHGGVYKQYLEGKTFLTHIVASNLTPKKRVEFERYKVVRPEWLVDCVKAGKALPWNQYRLIDNSSQKTIGFTPNSVASYKAVSSRDEKVMHGGSGLQLTPVKNEPSQESSSYPTPPELKSMDLDNIEHNVKSEQPENTSPLTQNRNLGGKKEFQLPSTLSPPKEEDTEVFVEDDLPNTLSPLEIFSGPSKGFQHTHQQSPLPRSRYPMPEAAQSLKEPPATLMEPENEPRTPPAQPNDLGLPSTLSPIQISSPLVRPSEPAPTTPLKPRNNTEPADQAAAHNAAILANPSLRPHTVVHPDFLKSYFDQSRLHYLSTWKADLKNQMQQLASLKPKRPRTSGRRMILHVDFDCFFCSVSLVARPELKDKPVCVGHGGAKSGEIASCNYVARNFGVHNGMSMQRGLELCKDMVCLPYDFPAYEKASRDFYEILLSVNADATQAVSVDEALLDVSSICDGSPDVLAQSIRDRVREKTQCDVSIGMGENVLLAKLALRKAKPGGQYHLKMEDVETFVKDLDVGDLPGIGWKLSDKLEEVMNIRTIGDVRTKSLSELKDKFGPKTGEKLYNFARGIDYSEVGEIVHRKSVSVEVNWGVRFETGEQVETFLQSLATELSARLVKESFTGSHMILKVMRRAADAPLDPPKHLGHGKCDTFNKSVQFGVPTNNAEVLAKETISMMKSLRIPPGELRGIGLQMGKLERIGELKLESGQKKLDFAKNVRTEQEQPHRSPEVKHRSPTIAESHSPIKATQFIAPTQIDPEVLANLPDDIRARIVSRKPVQVESSQIDEAIVRELPSSIQDELRQMYKKPIPKTTPKKKKPSPRKLKVVNMIGQSKLPMASPDDLDASVLAELPSTIRQEVISNNRREHALARATKARHAAWAAEKAIRDRKVNRTVTIPDPLPKPTFQKMSELPDIRNLISRWMEELRDEGPAEEDVELLGGYLRKVVLIEKDLRKAEAVVKWFLWCCRETGPAMDEWWQAGQRLGDLVNTACLERGVGRIDFDTQT